MGLMGTFFDLMRGLKRATILGSSGLFYGSPAIVSGAVGEIAAQQAMSVAAVYAAVHAYTDTISTVDFGISEIAGDGEANEFKPVRKHPLWTILNSEMNSEETSQQGIAYLIGSLLLQGNAYAQIRQTNIGRVFEIVPLDTSLVTPMRVEGKLVYSIAGWEKPLMAKEVIHVAINYDRKLLRGISPIGFARSTISLAQSLDNFGLSYFMNGAQPRVMLEHPGRLTEDQARQLVETYDQRNAGPDNAGKTGILTGGATLKLLTIPPEDSQFLESRKFSVNEIARVFGLPPSRIGGDRSSGTYANLAQDQLAFLLHSVRPVCRMFEQEFNRKLLKPEEKSTVQCKFNLDDLMASATESSPIVPPTSKTHESEIEK